MRTGKCLLLICLTAVLPGSAGAGRWMRTSVASPQLAGANVIPNPESLSAACRGTVNVLSTEKVETGSLSETFPVKWSTDFKCQTDASVTVTVTRKDGSRETKTETVKSVNQALVKVFGFREGNPTVSAAATVVAAGAVSDLRFTGGQ
jgi:hypothetical protein